MLYWGWRYLQVLPPGAGETLTVDDVTAIVQHQSRAVGRRATFDSDNPTLNAVFDLMQHSAIHSSEETFLDTPTREKGQFTGDTVDISYASMIAAGDRNATARAIREIVDSGTHSWKAASSGYCTAAQLPCSFPSIGTPGRVNAVYPNGDNMRDIPDYTEFVPEWVWRYYEQPATSRRWPTPTTSSRRSRTTCKTNIATTGNTAGLITTCSAGPAPTSTGSSTGRRRCATATRSPTTPRARSTTPRPSARARRGQGRAGARQDRRRRDVRRLGRRPRGDDEQEADPPDGLYTDGLSSRGRQPADRQHRRSTRRRYPLYYGIAPAANQASCSTRSRPRA